MARGNQGSARNLNVSLRLKAGDTVKVTSGGSVGKTGAIERVLRRTGQVVIPGVHVVKRHKKASAGQPGGISEVAMPIDASNVQLICPACKKPTRLGSRLEGDRKLRTCQKCDSVIG